MTLKASELNVGDTRTEVLVDDLTRTQIVMYAGSSGDYNPATGSSPFPSASPHWPP